MFRNKILDRIKRGEKALGLSMNEASEELVEIAGRMGLDFVNFDGQHAPLTPARVGTLCRIADGFGITPTMRIPDGQESTILSYLDRGIRQITVPNLLTKEEAQSLVKYTYFQPLGLRSSTSHKMVSYQDSQDRADLFADVNANVVLVPQIENINTVENLEEILTVGRHRLLRRRSGGHGTVHGHPRRPRRPQGSRGLRTGQRRSSRRRARVGGGTTSKPSTSSASSRGRWRAYWKPTAASPSSPGRFRLLAPPMNHTRRTYQ